MPNGKKGKSSKQRQTKANSKIHGSAVGYQALNVPTSLTMSAGASSAHTDQPSLKSTSIIKPSLSSSFYLNARQMH